MLLLDIRNHVQMMGSVSLTDLSRRFDVAESAMQGMVEQWVKKGNVEVMNLENGNCSSGACGGCGQKDNGCGGVRYRWKEYTSSSSF